MPVPGIEPPLLGPEPTAAVPPPPLSALLQVRRREQQLVLGCEQFPDLAVCPAPVPVASAGGGQHPPGPGKRASAHGCPANSSAAQVTGEEVHPSIP